MNTTLDANDHASPFSWTPEPTSLQPGDVACRAYFKWLSRSQSYDHQLQDWLDAEREVSRDVDTTRRLSEAWNLIETMVSDREESDRRLRAEHAISRILASSESLEIAAPKLLQAVGECLGWEVGAFWTLDRHSMRLRCVAVWHTESIRVDAFKRDARRRTYAPGQGLPGRVWAGATHVTCVDVAADRGFLRRRIATNEGLRGAIGFPVHNGVEVVGVLEFYSRQRLQPDDLPIEMMESVASNISQFIERRDAERLLFLQEYDRAVGREILEGLLPHENPVLPGFQVSGKSEAPNLVGGDFFDFFPLTGASAGVMGIVVADACGHGIGAAVLSAQTHAYLRALSLTTDDVSNLLALTNHCLCQNESRQFVTAFLAGLDPQSLVLTFTGAGHPPGYVLGSKGRIKAVLESTGYPLGMIPSADFPPMSLTLKPGDTVLLLTDGITEAAAPSGRQFGAERAVEMVRRHLNKDPDEILSALFAAVADFCNMKCHDDLTAVIIKAV